MKKLAIVGTGVAGLASAWYLRKDYDITLFESGDYAGGHTNTLAVREPNGKPLAVDTGFIVFNLETYPNLVKLFEELGVAYDYSDMSFGLYNRDTDLQWCSNGLRGLFAQKKNITNPGYLKFLLNANRFNKQAPADLSSEIADLPFGEYLKKRGYSDSFRDNFIIPMGSAVWSTSPDKMMNFPARIFIQFFVNHGFLSLYTGLKWRYVVGGSNTYVGKILKGLKNKPHLNEAVREVYPSGNKVKVKTVKKDYNFDKVILATHADLSLKMLTRPTSLQRNLLSHFRYEKNKAILHTDESVMPPLRSIWSSWNFKSQKNARTGLTEATCVYYMNRLQKLRTNINYFVSINETDEVDKSKVVKVINYDHPLFNMQTKKYQPELPALNKESNIFFAGSYFRYGFHEDAVLSAKWVAEAIKSRGK